MNWELILKKSNGDCDLICTDSYDIILQELHAMWSSYSENIWPYTITIIDKNAYMPRSIFFYESNKFTVL